MRLIIAVLLMLMPVMAQAQDPEPKAELTLNNQNAILKTGTRDSAVARFSADWWAGGKIGGWGYGYAEKGYFSSVQGLYISLPLALEVGAAIGLESYSMDSTRLRYAFIAGLGDVKKLGVEGYFETGASRDEDGKSQPWLRLSANWQVNRILGIGALAQMTRFPETSDGLGPKITLMLPDIPMTVWGMYSVLPGESKGNILFGGSFVATKY